MNSTELNDLMNAIEDEAGDFARGVALNVRLLIQDAVERAETEAASVAREEAEDIVAGEVSDWKREILSDIAPAAALLATLCGLIGEPQLRQYADQDYTLRPLTNYGWREIGSAIDLEMMGA